MSLAVDETHGNDEGFTNPEGVEFGWARVGREGSDPFRGREVYSGRCPWVSPTANHVIPLRGTQPRPVPFKMSPSPKEAEQLAGVDDRNSPDSPGLEDAAPFLNYHKLVRLDAPHLLDRAVGPPYFNPLHFLCGSEAKMLPKVALRNIA